MKDLFVFKKSEKKEVRRFGFVFSGLFMIFALINGIKGENICFLFLGLSIFILLAGLFSPFLLKPIYLLGKFIISFIMKVITNVVLFLLFYLIVAPIGFLARVTGKKFLDLKIKDKNRKTYWIEKTGKVNKKKYENQF